MVRSGMRNQGTMVAALLASLLPAGAWAQDASAEPTGMAGTLGALNRAFGDYVVTPLGDVLFFDVLFWDNGSGANTELPFIVAWLVVGATFFTFRFGLINLRAFRHAWAVTAGHFDRPDDPGEVTHFQALSSALSATVGLGNIAGVAVAVGVGGPGAIFWMVVGGFLGMSSKFAECTLGQMYRDRSEDGNILGGPMRYLQRGLAEQNMPRLGRFLSVLFAVMCIGGSLGGGNMFQANQSYAQAALVLPFLDSGWGALVYGVFVAILVGLVIIGGIRRIGRVASIIVPAMVGIYLCAGLFILITNADRIGPAFAQILAEAFTPKAGLGGFVGVLVTGFRRSAFSNEAGVGSAAIAHSAAATREPVREGIVALLEPFIDTIVVCTMTGLVVVVTGAYSDGPEEGVLMTSKAFATVLPWFPKVLSLAVFLFAFSTMISWSYYGERCWTSLFGSRTSIVYKLLFLACVILGSVLKLANVVDFSDLMILGMSFPNILGVYILSGRVRSRLDDYWSRYKSGQMQPER
ncbi:MAG: alanine/glycine:cation symporter family protein [Myxococcota bacterium]